MNKDIEKERMDITRFIAINVAKKIGEDNYKKLHPLQKEVLRDNYYGEYQEELDYLFPNKSIFF